MSDIASYEPDIANYEQLWNSFKAARENKEPQKNTTVKSNDEFYIEIVNVDSQSGHEIENKFEHEIVVHLCRKCSFRTLDQIEFQVHSSYHARLEHTNSGESSVKLRQTLTDKQVVNFKRPREPKQAIAQSTDLNCDQCFFTSNNKKSLDLHKQDVHIRVYTKCGQCSFKTKSKKVLNEHTQLEHLEFQLKCLECDSFYSNRKSLDVHLKSQHQGRVFPCKECSYKASRASCLREHMETQHEGIRFVCKECNKVLSHKSSLRSHQKLVHEKDKYKCTKCDYKGKSQGPLDVHKRLKHS